MTATPDPRPVLAVWKLASCDGCQLSLLELEDELLSLASVVRVARFPEFTRTVEDGPYDLSLVEGSVSTASDAALLQRIRAASRVVVAMGACATTGGVQALRNGPGAPPVPVAVGPVRSLPTSTPVSAHVDVDLELQGCPVAPRQLLEVVTAHVAGRRPVVPGHAVCHECKARGLACVLVRQGTACLGPVTRAGCGALCPSVGRGCYGCFGPAETANTASLAGRFVAGGMREPDVARLFRSVTAGAPAFRAEAEAHDPRATDR